MAEPDFDPDFDVMFTDLDADEVTWPEVQRVEAVPGGSLITIFLPTIALAPDMAARNLLYEASALVLFDHTSEVWNLL